MILYKVHIPFLALYMLMHCHLSLATLLVEILADSNRDGKIDQGDRADKMEWSDSAGAILVANIGDTNRRCSEISLHQEAPSSEELAACNDASDDVQRSPQYMAPLQVTAIPNDLSKNAWGSIVVRDGVARDKVRIFRKENDEWIFTPNYHKFKREDLIKGLELGIDARDTRRPGSWDGRVQVYIYVNDYDREGNSAWDAVRLRVAPVLTHHHAQKLERLVSVAGNDTDVNQKKFITDITRILDGTSTKVPLFLFSHSDDVWAQDLFEAGYTSMPGPNGSETTLRVMIRSPQNSRVAGRQVFEYLRDTGVGAVYHPYGSRDELDSMGNLETIPPYRHGEKNYPAGRIIQGSHELSKPHILDYMQAQEFQDPLLISTDWLVVGHVDEVVQFLPTKKVPTTHGWVLVVADHELGKKKLEEIEDKSIKAFSRPYGTPTLTVEELLGDPDFQAADEIMPTGMEEIINLLKKETGIKDSDIYRVPSVFTTGYCSPPDAGVAPEKNCSSKHVAALYPDIVNGVVLSDTEYLSVDPWGPVVSNVDIIKDAASKVYEKIGYNVNYIDDWDSHHTAGGEVHCGSNSIREVGDGWWKINPVINNGRQNTAGESAKVSREKEEL